ncbi:hypothetical protein HML84_13800 [Alcanivorax sp. IO_7]|nr:hypothetical protein HML84_13800 [Alcanivorax sp. IO_7]
MAGTEQGEYRFNRDYLDAYRDADGGLDSLYRQVPGIQFSEDALKPTPWRTCHRRRSPFPAAAFIRTRCNWTA